MAERDLAQQKRGVITSRRTDSVTVLARNDTVGWTLFPVAATEFVASTRHRMSLVFTSSTMARLTATIITALAGAKLKAQYSLNGGSSWTDLGCFVSVGVSNINVGAWVDIPEAARRDVWVRLVGYDGDGASTVGLGLIVLEHQ